MPPAGMAPSGWLPPGLDDIAAAHLTVSGWTQGLGEPIRDDDDERSALLALAHTGGSAKNRAAHGGEPGGIKCAKSGIQVVS